MMRKKIMQGCLLLIVFILLAGCTPSLSVDAPTSITTNKNSPTTISTSDIPAYKTNNNATGDVLLVKDKLIICHQNGLTADFYVYDQSTEETQLFYSVLAWGSIYSLDESSFLLSWRLENERYSHFLRYDIDSMESQEIQLKTDAYCNYIGYTENSYYYKRRSDTNMDEFAVCKLSDTGELIPVAEHIEEPIEIAHNRIYYMKNRVVYRCNLQGKMEESVWDCSQLPLSNVRYFQVINDTIFLSCYMAETSWVFSLKDKSTSVIQTKLYPDDCAEFGEFLYMESTNGIYRIQKDTLQTEKISDLYAYGLNVIDNVLYFSGYEELNEETGYPASDIHVYAMELETGVIKIVI